MGALALFLVMGGSTAYAVTQIGTDSIKSRHIVNGEVKSADLANDKVKGRDVNESSLGEVPLATNADSAGDADTLGGSSPADFLGSDSVLWASVNADGSLARGSAGVRSLHSQNDRVGLYLVELPSGYNSVNCTYVGSVGRTQWDASADTIPGGELSAQPYTGAASDRHVVIVQTRASDGTKADRPFHLAVFCP